MQYNTKHPVYPVLQQIGKEITQKVKPKAVVVFSAHWMGEEHAIHVNNAVDTPLIYECVTSLDALQSFTLTISVSTDSPITFIKPNIQTRVAQSLRARLWSCFQKLVSNPMEWSEVLIMAYFLAFMLVRFSKQRISICEGLTACSFQPRNKSTQRTTCSSLALQKRRSSCSLRSRTCCICTSGRGNSHHWSRNVSTQLT